MTDVSIVFAHLYLSSQAHPLSSWAEPKDLSPLVILNLFQDLPACR